MRGLWTILPDFGHLDPQGTAARQQLVRCFVEAFDDAMHLQVSSGLCLHNLEAEHILPLWN